MNKDAVWQRSGLGVGGIVAIVANLGIEPAWLDHVLTVVALLGALAIYQWKRPTTAVPKE